MLALRNQGIILGPDGARMSKSRGNVVLPDELVQRYGADTVRGYLMFGWRWEQGGPWASQGIEGIHRWLKRVWNLALAPAGADGSPSRKEIAHLRRWTHKTIRRVTEDLEEFAFNTTISGLMEFTNALQKAKETPLCGTEAWEEAVGALLLLLAPCCPHIAEELWARTGRPYSIHQQLWPQWHEEIAAEEVITLVVQVNGRVRDRLKVTALIEEEQAKRLALSSEGAKRHTGGKRIARVIYVPQRLVNIVTA